MFRRLLFAFWITNALASECPQGWTFEQSTSICFLISTRTYSFDDAESYCSSQGGQLTSIKTTTEENALIAMTKNMFLPPWTGGYLAPNATRWSWIDHTFFSNRFWAPGEPSSFGNCAVLRSNGMAAAPCYSQQPALCYQYPALCNSDSFSGFNGTFSSPGYPVQYYNNLMCSYVITSPSINTFITITFDPYLVEAIYDYIKVFNGNSTSPSDLIGRKNGYANEKDTFESTSHQMTVLFTTDTIGTSNGWLATWQAKPDYKDVIQKGDGGQTSSINFPSKYDSFTEQNYYITVPDSFKVNMTFDIFRTENNYDHLVIWDSPVLNSGRMIANLSGIYSSPFYFQSSSSAISMRFTSDGQLEYEGWHMTWFFSS